MKTKCYKCGHKNEENVYSCEKCSEIFRQSREKYEQYLKKHKRNKNEKSQKSFIPENYKTSRIITLLPILFVGINVIIKLYAGIITRNYDNVFDSLIQAGLIGVITLITLGVRHILIIHFFNKHNIWSLYLNIAIILIWVTSAVIVSFLMAGISRILLG